MAARYTGDAAGPVAFVALWTDSLHFEVDVGRHGDRFVQRSAVLELLDKLLRLRLGRSHQLKTQIDALKARGITGKTASRDGRFRPLHRHRSLLGKGANG